MSAIIKKKALLVGINYVGSNCELHGCINDIINMRQFLITERGYTEDNIVMLNETSKDKKPTRANIIKWIFWLVADSVDGSDLFFHYSGHGGSTIDRNGDESDGKDETICPVDYATSGQIVDDDLKKALVSPLVKGAKLTCLFDSCHSGTVLDLHCTYKVDAYTPMVADEHYRDSLGDVIEFSGCKDEQTSADAYEEGLGQGAMTYCFLKTCAELKRLGKPLTYKKILKQLLKFIKFKGYEQIPQLCTGHPIDINTIW